MRGVPALLAGWARVLRGCLARVAGWLLELGDSELTLLRVLLSKEPGAAPRGARLGPGAGAGRCARPESGGGRASRRRWPRERGWPRLQPRSAAPLLTRARKTRSGPATVGAQPFFGGLGLAGRRRRRPGFPHAAPRAHHPDSSPGQATSPGTHPGDPAKQHGTLPFWTLGPSLLCWKYLLCDSQLRSWPGVSLGKRCSCSVRACSPQAHSERRVPSQAQCRPQRLCLLGFLMHSPGPSTDPRDLPKCSDY